MSERITGVTATAFRGVPGTLAINLKQGQSLLVLGDNGTGKSTIADALEWYFTGRIAYLSHEGRGTALRNYAASPDVATVVDVATAGSLGGRAALPDGPPSAPRSAGQRETFLLRGRTLAEFVDRSKAEKWRVIAEILGLESVDKLRLDLQRARNDLGRDLRKAQEAVKRGAEALAAALGTGNTRISCDRVVEAISRRCRDAGVDPPGSFAVVIDPVWHAAQPAPGASVAAPLASLVAELRVVGPSSFSGGPVERWNREVSDLGRPDAHYIAMLTAAREVLRRSEDAMCPLCQQPIDLGSLRRMVVQSLTDLKEASDRLQSVRGDLQGLTRDVDDAEQWRRERWKKAAGLGITFPDVPASPARSLREAIASYTAVAAQPLRDYSEQLRAWDAVCADAVGRAMPAEGTSRDEFLGEIAMIAQKARDWSNAVGGVETIERAYKLANAIFEGYQDHQGRHIREILERISGRVAEIYGFLHPREGLGSVDVELWGDKGVELAVDFHGRLAKPPHGVPSESHLNSLAIALFLGMAETFNDRIGFLVLDDVVNSFDIEHRGQLAQLLATGFEERQLIVMTHDPIFFERISKLAPSWRRLEFTSWSYDQGPRMRSYETQVTIGQARQALAANDTMGAAQKGRRALEELLQEICEGLAAPLPFRRGRQNDQREAIELVNGLRRTLKEYAPALLRELAPLLRLLEADVAAALNTEAHASTGQASLAEVASVLDRIEQLDRQWSCIQCGTRDSFKGTPEAARCRCGSSHFPPLASSS